MYLLESSFCLTFWDLLAWVFGLSFLAAQWGELYLELGTGRVYGPSGSYSSCLIDSTAGKTWRETKMTDKTTPPCDKDNRRALNVGFKMRLFIPGWMYVNGNWVLLILLQLLCLSFSPPILKLKINLLARAWPPTNWFPFQAGQRIPLAGCITHQTLWLDGTHWHKCKRSLWIQLSWRMPMSWSSLKPQLMHVWQLTSPSHRAQVSTSAARVDQSRRVCLIKGPPFRIVHKRTCQTKVLNLLKALSRLFCS